MLASERFPAAGAWLFAVLAAAGDIGASSGSALTGVVVDAARSSSAEEAAIRTGLGFAVIFPIGALIALFAMRAKKDCKCQSL